MKTGILILLTSLVWNLQLSGQMIPENVTLKQLDGKEITCTTRTGNRIVLGDLV